MNNRSDSNSSFSPSASQTSQGADGAERSAKRSRSEVHRVDESPCPRFAESLTPSDGGRNLNVIMLDGDNAWTKVAFLKGDKEGSSKYVCRECHPQFEITGTVTNKIGGVSGVLSAFHTGNFLKHLGSVHGIFDSEHPTIMRFIAKDEDARLANDNGFKVLNGVAMTRAEAYLAALSESYMPFETVERDIWRQVFTVPVGIKKCEAVPEKMREMTTKFLNHKLKECKGGFGCLAIDGGTQWTNKYIATVLHVIKDGELSSFLYDLCPLNRRPFKLETEDKGEASSDRLATYVDGIVVDLRKRGIIVTSVATDNASNMIGIRTRSRSNIFFLPCIAHSTQLLAQDIIRSLRFNEIVDQCKLYRAQNPSLRLPECNETRWNSHVRLAHAVCKKIHADPSLIAGSPFSSATLKKMSQFVEYMMPLWMFTDFIQCEHATLLDALAALEVVYRLNDERPSASMALPHAEFAELFANRVRRYISDPLVILAFFCPTLLPESIAEAEFEEITKIVQQIVRSSAASKATGYTPATIEGEFIAFTACFPPRAEEPSQFTTDSYSYWVVHVLSPRFPALGDLVARCMCMMPTEAAAERAFSILSKIVDSRRTTLTESNAAMQLQLNLLLRDFKTTTQWKNADGERSFLDVDGANHDDDAAVDFSSIPISHMWLNYILQSARIMVERRSAALVEAETKTCARCNRNWASHEDGGVDRIACIGTCKRVFSAICAQKENVSTDVHSWKCSKCLWNSNSSTTPKIPAQ